MLKIRRLLPGEERTYNNAENVHGRGDGAHSLQYTIGDKKYWAAMVVGDGSTIIEPSPPCSVRFKDGGRTSLLEALEEIANDTHDVRHARVVAKRALREVE